MRRSEDIRDTEEWEERRLIIEVPHAEVWVSSITQCELWVLPPPVSAPPSTPLGTGSCADPVSFAPVALEDRRAQDILRTDPRTGEEGRPLGKTRGKLLGSGPATITSPRLRSAQAPAVVVQVDRSNMTFRYGRLRNGERYTK